MNILKALEQLTPGKISMAEHVNSCLHEKDYDLRHSIYNLSTLETHRKKLQAMKNIINISDKIVAFMKANQSIQDDFEWEEADNEIYNYVFDLRNLMVKYQKDYGQRNEWLYKAA